LHLATSVIDRTESCSS